MLKQKTIEESIIREIVNTQMKRVLNFVLRSINGQWQLVGHRQDRFQRELFSCSIEKFLSSWYWPLLDNW